MQTRAVLTLFVVWTGLLMVRPVVGQEKKTQQGKDSPESKKSIIAVFSLDGPIIEKPRSEDFPFGDMNAESLKDLAQRMKEAAEDDDIKAAVVLLGNSSLGTGQIEEVRGAIKRLQEAGKDVYAHADSLNMHQYVLLCGATKLSVAPNGDIWINGVYGEGLYVRGLLDMIGVQPDFTTCGEYKSAAEMFMRKGPSPEAAKMYDWLFDSIYDSYLQLIAEGRGVDKGKVRSWVDHGLYSAESATKAGIIDAAEYRDEFVKTLKKTYSDEVVFNKAYGKSKGPEIDFSNPFAAFQIWSDLLFGKRQRPSRKDAVAIVYVDGPIMPGKPDASPFGEMEGAFSDPIRRALDEVADDDRVKGVVLRVDSPGGSAVASEIILQATKRVKAKKPFVVSMGNVAGSGGYYVACGADTIFADSTTITGSIGVVAGKLATSGMWNKIGIHWDPIQRGKNADLLSSSHVFTDEQREMLLAWMNEIYDVFKQHVTKIRGDRLAKSIDELAGGRIFTGKQALELGLVDRLGGLDEAIRFVAEQADLKDYEIRVEPKPKNFVELLFGDLAQPKKEDNERTLSLPATMSGSTGNLFQLATPLLNDLDPHRIHGVRSALTQLELFKREKVLLTMPIIQIQSR